MTYKVTINNKLYTTTEHLTILQLCTRLNIQIPKFCYHELLSIAGNCRMCLVQVNNSMKPVASCATNIMDGMIINTNNFFVQKARESVIEFLLINHPLDCPICDQAGECDLQDQTLYFGSDRGRFNEIKRSVVDKNLGPFIKTIMTRCIHCTRCVRFSNEIAGVSFLGTVGRGRDTEISNYIYTVEMNSPLSGNLIDICPVGALTSKPYAFVGRPWELSKVETVDVFDTLGSRIRVDTRGSDILRVLPRYTKAINEEWITDKIRFCYDGLKLQRLVIPLSKRFSWKSGENFFYKNVSWDDSLKLFRSFYIFSVFNHPFSFSQHLECGSILDYFSLLNVKHLCNHINFCSSRDLDSRLCDFDFSYRLNDSYESLSDSSFYLMLGLNAEHDLPILNTYIRKSVLEKDSQVFYLGFNTPLNYVSHHLGFSLKTISKILKGSHFISYSLSSQLKKSIIFNNFSMDHSLCVTSLASRLASCVAYPVISSPLNLQSLNINLNNSVFSNVKLFDASEDFILNISSVRKFQNVGKRSVFIGTNGHDFSTSYSLLLPSFSFVEMDSAVFNLNGCFSRVRKVVPTPGLTRSVGDILLAFLSLILGSSQTDASFIDSIEFKEVLNKSSFFSSSFPVQFGLFPLLHNADSKFFVFSHNYYKDNEVVSNSRILSSRFLSLKTIF